MWQNQVTQENISKLKRNGIDIIKPGYGELACGYKGYGRLSDIPLITKTIAEMIVKSDDLSGKKVLVTAGPTHEDIDPVRYLSNKSSGRMGFSLARAAISRGAEVTLITGPTDLVEPFGAKRIDVKTAEQMKKEVFQNSKCDIFIGAAAVSDYKVEKHEQKMKKKDKINLELIKNPDILYEFSKINGKGKIIVGFALETEDLIQNAKKKLERKHIDLICANGTDAFGSDLSTVFLITKHETEEINDEPKIVIANRILDKILSLPKSL